MALLIPKPVLSRENCYRASCELSADTPRTDSADNAGWTIGVSHEVQRG